MLALHLLPSDKRCVKYWLFRMFLYFEWWSIRHLKWNWHCVLPTSYSFSSLFVANSKYNTDMSTCPPVCACVCWSVGLSVSRLSVCSLVIGPVINQSVIAKTIQIVLEKFACDNMKYDFAVKQLHVFTISSRLAESKHTTCKVVHCFQITDTF